MKHGMTRLLRSAALMVGILTSAGLAGAQTPADTSGTSGWKTIVYPVYGWAPIFGADVRLPEQPSTPGSGGGAGGVGVSIPSASTSGNFNGAAFGGFRDVAIGDRVADADVHAVVWVGT